MKGETSMRCNCGCYDMDTVNVIDDVYTLKCFVCKRQYTQSVDEVYSYEKDPITNRIHRLRYLVMFHSYIYYHLGENLVSDTKWTEWALELNELQINNKELAKTVRWDSIFEDFDPCTGFNLEVPEKIRQNANSFASNKNANITYNTENNTFVNKEGTVIYDIFKYVTPSDLLLFKKNKKSVIIKSKAMGNVRLVYLMKGDCNVKTTEKTTSKTRSKRGKSD